ncbi:MAG: type II toxin-antitoxin system VapC family toxin [Planctomycetes bacterium]|nr:type II toxin-antitoxin system VapC family toxin [Planctomycetota bacterium]MBU4398189.1 type II toxin-antitoxin system VapC family toxin [Planctomycetota bacterium]MCG2685679.1 type II toxin-antitoxin system VapC family toxin [Planctomycetales bacterium]
MNDLIVDSCVVVKLVLAEPDSEQTYQLFQSVRGAGGRLFVLDVALAEAANAVWKQHHRGLLDSSDAIRFLGYLLAAPVDIQASHHLMSAAFDIAVKYDRSVYDALFVALADDLQLTGVTADEPLWKAVNKDFPNIVLLRHWKP